MSTRWRGEHFPASLLGKVNEPATAEAIHNVDVGQGHLMGFQCPV